MFNRNQEQRNKSSVGNGTNDFIQSEPNGQIVQTLGAQRPPESLSFTRVSYLLLIQSVFMTNLLRLISRRMCLKDTIL